MTKEYHIQEMEYVLHDVLNPLNDRDTEIEAWHLVENEGWRKLQQGTWLVRKYMTTSDYTIACSICGGAHSRKEYESPYCYCPNCGNIMTGTEVIK